MGLNKRSPHRSKVASDFPSAQPRQVDKGKGNGGCEHEFPHALIGEVESRKKLGAYYTPPEIAIALVRWVVRAPMDRLLDPACGDGRFLAAHQNSVGVERDVAGVVAATHRARPSAIHMAEFFSWAEECKERFDCAAGNPPFIRYQQFAGAVRNAALRLCSQLGADFSGLTSSWAPFLVATASLLKPGGRMAFIVPAEIGHAPYARPLVTYLARHFATVLLVGVREKLFPDLSEDVWILYADGFGRHTDRICFARTESFRSWDAPPRRCDAITVAEWESWNYRLRPCLLNRDLRNLYERMRCSADVVTLGEVARVGIGYVTGANDFFHLRPSVANARGIPPRYLVPSIRNGRWLRGQAITRNVVDRWLEEDEPVLLLRLPKDRPLHPNVWNYLHSLPGRQARTSFKCRNRQPWYAVPDIRIPDAFLSYMSGEGPCLVANEAGCSCTNSVHAVSLKKEGWDFAALAKAWSHPLARLSCEMEGHPLGGGMLKVEPGEAARILLPRPTLRLSAREFGLLEEGIEAMRRWRHYE